MILGGDKGYIESEFTKEYGDIDYQHATDLALPLTTFHDDNQIIITYGSNYGGADYIKNRFFINNSIGSIRNFFLKIAFNITVSAGSNGLKIVKYKKNIDPPYYEIVEETIITGGVNINIGGWNYIQYENVLVNYWLKLDFGIE